MFAYKIFCGILGNVAPAVKPTSLPPDEKKSIMEREPTEKELFKVGDNAKTPVPCFILYVLECMQNQKSRK
jgi:hypothetical protein